MEKRLLNSAIILIISFIAYLPSAIGQKLSIGPMAGVNISSISEVNNTESLAGLNAGVFLNYSVNENLGFGLKGLFSQLGTGFKNSDDHYRLNYIQLPLSVAYFFGERGNTIRPKVFIGPYVGFLMNAQRQNGDDLIGFNSTDFGGQIGAGFNYSFKNRSWLNFDLGYSAGFVDIIEISALNYNNNAFFVSLGYSFPLSTKD